MTEAERTPVSLLRRSSIVEVAPGAKCRVYVEDGKHWMERVDGSVPLVIVRADRVQIIDDDPELHMHTDCKNRQCQMVADMVATLEATLLGWRARAIAAEERSPVSWPQIDTERLP